MITITVPNDKKMVFVRPLTRKDTSGMNLRTSPQILEKSCQYRKEYFKIKLCTKKSTLLVYKRKYLVSASFLLFNKAMPDFW